jgi:hypothetical protein
MLIRRKSSTDDEYHHEDPLGVFGVITGANGAVLSSNVYDAFASARYQNGNQLTPWITSGVKIAADSMLWLSPNNSYFGSRALSNKNALQLCLAFCSSYKNIFSKLACMALCYATFSGGSGGGSGGSNNGCPAGTCAFKCPGETAVGCGYPGTTITCKDGTKIPLPNNCSKVKKTSAPCIVHPLLIPDRDGIAVGIGCTIKF